MSHADAAMKIAIQALEFIAERKPVEEGFWNSEAEADEPAHSATVCNVTARAALRRMGAAEKIAELRPFPTSDVESVRYKR